MAVAVGVAVGLVLVLASGSRPARLNSILFDYTVVRNINTARSGDGCGIVPRVPSSLRWRRHVEKNAHGCRIVAVQAVGHPIHRLPRPMTLLGQSGRSRG